MGRCPDIILTNFNLPPHDLSRKPQVCHTASQHRAASMGRLTRLGKPVASIMHLKGSSLS